MASIVQGCHVPVASRSSRALWALAPSWASSLGERSCSWPCVAPAAATLVTHLPCQAGVADRGGWLCHWPRALPPGGLVSGETLTSEPSRARPRPSQATWSSPAERQPGHECPNLGHFPLHTTRTTVPSSVPGRTVPLLLRCGSSPLPARG